ncbi:MAG: FHA domain-containing protein, partial [Pseudomonadales bacterium]|nr:FHA domain-containing protein [Pseudomonadales bacterium]
MLKIQFRDGRADPLPLLEPGKTIGKGAVNDIVIDEEGVNGFHADLKVDGSQVVLSDVNTESGTWLNGEKVTAPVPVRAGDVITIQGVELDVVESEEESESKTLVLSGTALLAMGAG